MCAAKVVFTDAGPNTIVGLSKQAEGVSFDASKAVAALVPAYSHLLQSLKDLGVPEVQMHEPILTTHRADSLKANFSSTYAELSKAGLPIDLVTYYDDVGAAYPWLVQLPVQVCPSPLPLFNPAIAVLIPFMFFITHASV
jgi:5-methyltetrahydropteroyltriglutamate--homocysteine methyltransferase